MKIEINPEYGNPHKIDVDIATEDDKKVVLFTMRHVESFVIEMEEFKKIVSLFNKDED